MDYSSRSGPSRKRAMIALPQAGLCRPAPCPAEFDEPAQTAYWTRGAAEIESSGLVRGERLPGPAQSVHDDPVALALRQRGRSGPLANRLDPGCRNRRVEHPECAVYAPEIGAQLGNAFLRGDHLAREFGSFRHKGGSHVKLCHSPLNVVQFGPGE